MAELTNQDKKWGNFNLITKVFQEEEARAICQIPLSPIQPNDLLIWWYTTNENLSVRSVYHMEKEL